MTNVLSTSSLQTLSQDRGQLLDIQIPSPSQRFAHRLEHAKHPPICVQRRAMIKLLNPSQKASLN
jgi:hypothetical protein